MLLPKGFDKGFVWLTRYSDTDENDKFGRWARICYYNGFMICWVSGYIVEDGKILMDRAQGTPNSFLASLNFPTSQNQSSATGKFDTFEEAKKFTQEMFLDFKKLINK